MTWWTNMRARRHLVPSSSASRAPITTNTQSKSETLLWKKPESHLSTWNPQTLNRVSKVSSLKTANAARNVNRKQVCRVSGQQIGQILKSWPSHFESSWLKEVQTAINFGFSPQFIQKTLHEILRTQIQKNFTPNVLKIAQNAFISQLQPRRTGQTSANEAKKSVGELSTVSKISEDLSWIPDLGADETLGRCLQCLRNAVNVQVSDCSHNSLCSECAPLTSYCPQCFHPITATTRMFVVESGAPSQFDARTNLMKFYQTWSSK